MLRRAWHRPSWQMELDATEPSLKLGSNLRPSRASLDLQELCKQMNASQASLMEPDTRAAAQLSCGTEGSTAQM